MKCPLCQTTLPARAAECSRCDWVRRKPRALESRDRMAFWLSLAIPGLGHLYKGHVVLGGLLFFIVGPGILLWSLGSLQHTVGASLIAPLVFLFVVMIHAYRIRDLRAETIDLARRLDEKRSVSGARAI